MKDFVIRNLAIIVLLLISLIVAAFFTLQILRPKQTATATINNRVFKLLVARTEEEKQIGLSKFDSLPKDKAILFIFEKADFYHFWMRDMKFPIDIIFINDDKIVTIHQDLKSPKSQDENIPTYTSDEPADKVLEINAGLSKKYNFKKGDKVKVSQ